jgi:hypothetical protein
MNPPDEIKSEVRGNAGGKGGVDQAQDEAPANQRHKKISFSDIKQKAKIDSSTKGASTALPKLVIECRANWVVCHHVQNIDKRSKVVRL